MLAARAARSMRGGGGAREMKAVGVVGSERIRNDGVVVVIVVFGVVRMSSLHLYGLCGGCDARMLAARAARSMRGGGGAREMKVVGVVGSERVRNDGRGVVVGSWSLEVRPLETSTAVGTWRSVPEFCGGRKKGAAGCSLSSSAKGSSQLKGECSVCSGGRGGRRRRRRPSWWGHFGSEFLQEGT